MDKTYKFMGELASNMLYILKKKMKITIKILLEVLLMKKKI